MKNKTLIIIVIIAATAAALSLGIYTPDKCFTVAD